METVVLLHGLWMSGWAMAAQRRWLAAGGFAVEVFSFPTVRETLDHNARSLAAFARSCTGSRVHLVGHSLGGLVILRMLAAANEPRLGRAVLLGSPVRGSEVARSLMRVRWGRAAIGRSLGAWDEASHGDVRWPCDVGMIAGEVAVGAGRLIAPGLGPNDGTVTVAETRLPSFTDHIVLRVSHTGMLLSRAVADQTCRFLRTGRFEHRRAAS